MNLQNAFAPFRRLGGPKNSFCQEFTDAYFRLTRRYHPDVNPETHELMANINAARTTILHSYRRPS